LRHGTGAVPGGVEGGRGLGEGGAEEEGRGRESDAGGKRMRGKAEDIQI